MPNANLKSLLFRTLKNGKVATEVAYMFLEHPVQAVGHRMMLPPRFRKHSIYYEDKTNIE